jgi:mannonate dehydratase
MTILEHLPWDKVNDETLSFFSALSVDYLSIHPSPPVWDGKDRIGYWKEMKDLAAKHDLVLRNVGTKTWEEIALGCEDRDRQIDAWCLFLRNLGEAGIPTLGYTFQPGGYFRTTAAVGRGGAQYSTFDYQELQDNPTVRDRISEEALWENLAFFLERALPVAEEAGVVMALHPDDPPVRESLGGAARIVSSLDQFEEIFRLKNSLSHRMLFCQGCVAEMGEDIPSAIHRMADQIAYVHFRNIRGTPAHFEEVFVDEGDQDMIAALEAYKAIGFKGPFMMDHTPAFPDSEDTFWSGRAFAVGYIRSAIQSVFGR